MIETLIEDFRAVLDEYEDLSIGRKVHTSDAFSLWRVLLGRNPSPSDELDRLLTYPGTFRDLLNEIVRVPELRYCTPIIPAGYEWMSEVDGIRFWFDTGDREMGVRIAMGAYERETVELLKSVIKKGMRCINAGANTGYYACLMGKLVEPDGQVVAFEPMPQHVNLMKRNVIAGEFENVGQDYDKEGSDKNEEIEGRVSQACVSL